MMFFDELVRGLSVQDFVFESFFVLDALLWEAVVHRNEDQEDGKDNTVELAIFYQLILERTRNKIICSWLVDSLKFTSGFSFHDPFHECSGRFTSEQLWLSKTNSVVTVIKDSVVVSEEVEAEDPLVPTRSVHELYDAHVTFFLEPLVSIDSVSYTVNLEW